MNPNNHKIDIKNMLFLNDWTEAARGKFLCRFKVTFVVCCLTVGCGIFIINNEVTDEKSVGNSLKYFWCDLIINIFCMCWSIDEIFEEILVRSMKMMKDPFYMTASKCLVESWLCLIKSYADSIDNSIITSRTHIT